MSVRTRSAILEEMYKKICLLETIDDSIQNLQVQMAEAAKAVEDLVAELKELDNASKQAAQSGGDRPGPGT